MLVVCNQEGKHILGRQRLGFETYSASDYIIQGKGFHLFDLVLHLEMELRISLRVVVRIKI